MKTELITLEGEIMGASVRFIVDAKTVDILSAYEKGDLERFGADYAPLEKIEEILLLLADSLGKNLNH